MGSPAPLLLVYDAENARLRRSVEWIRKRDVQGLVVTFPFQNPELLRMAPELAGHALHHQAHGLDTRTRQVWTGPRLTRQVLTRLPGWRWVKFLMAFPILYRMMSKLTIEL